MSISDATGLYWVVENGSARLERFPPSEGEDLLFELCNPGEPKVNDIGGSTIEECFGKGESVYWFVNKNKIYICVRESRLTQDKQKMAKENVKFTFNVTTDL